MADHETESEFLFHEPCPDCGSSDNLGRYSDGHGHCFGCGYWEKGDGDEEETTGSGGVTLPSVQTEGQAERQAVLPQGQVQALTGRRISEETCQKWGYTTGVYSGKPVQIATYRDDTRAPVAAKLRFADKDMIMVGDGKSVGLYGKWLWSGNGKMLVITEGEIDALSVSQAQGNKYPVVSIAHGSKGALKDVMKEYDWVTSFEKVILWFDNDEPGQAAAAEVAEALPPGIAHVVKGDLKDANEYLKSGRTKDIVNLIWRAEQYRPDGLVRIEDLIDEAAVPVEMGMPWFLEQLTKDTYGRRYSEVYGFGGGTGCGKTDWFTQQAVYDAEVLGEQVGMIYLEMPAKELTRRLAGKVGHTQYHIPNPDYDEAQFRADAAKLNGKVVIYAHFGETDWDVIKHRIRYANRVEGVRIFYVDHLTAMADPSRERESLETIMKEMAKLAQELNIMVHFVSHLTTPESGSPHEEGGRVTIRQFKGSRSIGYWSHFMFGIERDTQDTGSPSTFRCLKDRLTGNALGCTYALAYDRKTGLLYPAPDEDEPFTDETGEPPPF